MQRRASYCRRVWFIFVLAGLALVTISGIYTRRRIAAALAYVGASPRVVRIVRWAIAWLLFGYPVLIIISIVISLLLGSATIPRFDGLLASLLLGVPFVWAVLVVLQSVLWVIAFDVAYLIVRRRRGVAAATRLRSIGVLAVVASFAIYTPVRVLVEHGDVRIREHRVTVASPSGAPPLRIAFLADIQQDVHTDSARAREIYELVNARAPDLVLSGGDWINSGPDHIAETGATAAHLKSRLGTFSVRGDHEHFAYVDRDRSVAEIEAALAAGNVAMLNNEVRYFEHAGKRIAVLLLNYNYIVRTDRETIVRLVETMASADYRIVVTHQLDDMVAGLLADKVNLVLAGHTHGGQLNPVVGLIHVNLARLETEYVDGRYQLGSTTIIVTAGVGYSIVPVRYASPGSIEIIELAL